MYVKDIKELPLNVQQRISQSNKKLTTNKKKKEEGERGRHGNKFTKRIINGREVLFDSLKEAKYYDELYIKERIGQIRNLETQKSFELIPTMKHNGITLRKITYKADFYFIENNKIIVVDTKGFATDNYKIKKRLFLQKYPHIDFREIT